MTYEVTGRIARITFNRPDQGNSITYDTPIELADAVERADLDPRGARDLVSGRGKGFCGGYDLAAFAERMDETGRAPSARRSGTVLSSGVQIDNHDPAGTWDPMVDYAMMSRFNRGFSSLLHANKPTVAKLHGFCVAGGTDIALYADQIIAADDTKIGYPPTRVWGIPAAGMWAHRSATSGRSGCCSPATRSPARRRGVGTRHRGSLSRNSSTSGPRSCSSGSRGCRSTS